MLDVHNDRLVVEEKGIYSIEKFIVARRLMYWQVYLHKTVLSAEFMLVNVLRRARQLRQQGTALFASPALDRFLKGDFTKADFIADSTLLEDFCRLDDYDILSAIKVWQDAADRVLADLCRRLVKRELFKIELRKAPFTASEIAHMVDGVAEALGVTREEAKLYVIAERIDNRAYNTTAHSIGIKFKDGSVVDVAEASDHLNLSALANTVEKHFLCYPREVRGLRG
jgi:HD superfamily phosphohydrolase